MATKGDTFDVGSDTNLSAHTPTGANAGTGWDYNVAGGSIEARATFNDAREQNSGNGNRARLLDDLGFDEMDVEADFTIISGGSPDLFFGLQARLPGTGTTSAQLEAGYDQSLASGTGAYYIFDGTTLYQSAGEAFPGSQTKLLFQVRDGSLVLKAGGVTKVSQSLSVGYAGNNYAGLLLGNFSGSSYRLSADNFLATGVSGGGVAGSLVGGGRLKSLVGGGLVR